MLCRGSAGSLQMLVSLMRLMPLSVILTLVMYCSFYPAYTAVFERPEPIRTP